LARGETTRIRIELTLPVEDGKLIPGYNAAAQDGNAYWITLTRQSMAGLSDFGTAMFANVAAIMGIT
ncbi:unnamed protein product, partial [Amoebophrya sp. A120]